jgi:hypothetical protein
VRIPPPKVRKSYGVSFADKTKDSEMEWVTNKTGSNNYKKESRRSSISRPIEWADNGYTV